MLPFLVFRSDALDDDITALPFIEELLEDRGYIGGSDISDLHLILLLLRLHGGDDPCLGIAT